MLYCKYPEERLTELSQSEIQSEIDRMALEKAISLNEEQAIKLAINSIYGCIGSPHFIAYNKSVAEAVTLQGQDIIKYAVRVCNDYFKRIWHKDRELHKALGVDVVVPVSNPMSVGCDTDSNYIPFNEVIQSCNWSGSPQDFILKLYHHRLKSYLDKNMVKYAEKFNTENLQQFELENISYSGIWLAKKKYVLDIAWKDPGINYEINQKLSAKGVEIARGGTPPFARKKMIELVKYITVQRSQFTLGPFVKLLNTAKREFVKQWNLDDICFSVTLGDYEKYVINDTTKVELRSKCPVYIRAAACYNYMIKNSGMRNRYQLIKTGDKIKYYYTKESYSKVFAYIPGDFPYELDIPDMDKDVQFFKCMIQPLNRFVNVMGYSPINSGLVVGRAIF